MYNFELQDGYLYGCGDGNLFYTNDNGVFMLRIDKNNSKPVKLISVEECKNLKRDYAVKKLEVINQNEFYILTGEEEGDHVYQFKKK